VNEVSDENSGGNLRPGFVDKLWARGTQRGPIAFEDKGLPLFDLAFVMSVYRLEDAQVEGRLAMIPDGLRS
jgi:hypothetical protein